MLDPLTALSLASAVVQLVDFGCKLMSQSQELYHSASGATKHNVTLGEITKDIEELSQNLKKKQEMAHTSGTDDVALEKIVLTCQEEAGKLLRLLNGLKLPPGATRWDAFRKAIKNARKAARIEEVESRLAKIQRQLDTHLLYIMSNEQSALLSRLNMIAKEHTSLQLESAHRMEQLKAEIRSYAKRQVNDSNRAQNLSCKLQILAEEGQRVANEETILKSLQFDEWKRRFNVVSKAYKQTFEWMLQDPEDDSRPPTGFKEWLRSQNGIYWIAGKAGSGKSTLMKFLSDHEEVSRCLQAWAGPSTKAVTIPWFFWNAGSPMQKSREGLFQSLLFQILRRCPSLIPIVCSTRWHDFRAYGEKRDPWTLDELSHAFDVLAQQTFPGIRFCLFIDGLDEYDGLPNELIRILRGIAQSQNIKLCLSSRRWTPFREAFEGGKCEGSLLLERYTKPDIEHFVRDLLEKDECFAEAERKDKRYAVFIQNVIERAKGVFLWVQLVVTRLLKGLGERNRLEDLQNRLDTMPRTLKRFFQQMFDRIDEADMTESARIFLITAHAVQPLSITAYHYLEREDREPGFALTCAAKPMSPPQLQHVCRDVSNRLNFLCQDLLEVNESIVDPTFVDFKVDFLHRTVRDFLMTKDMYSQLMQRATKDNTCDWDAHQSLCNVALARAKSLSLQKGIRPGLNVLFALVDEFMFYAHEVENEQKGPLHPLIDELDRVISNYADADMACHWTNARDSPAGLHFNEANHNDFLALAIQSRLDLYVKHTLDHNRNLIGAKAGRPYLDYALRPNIVTPVMLPHLVEFIDFNMVSILLQKGADPNQKVSIYGNITVWGLFLLSCYEKKDASSLQVRNVWFQAAEMMIRKGADRRLKLQTNRRETFTRGSEPNMPDARTAKYRRPIVRGATIEMDVPVDLTAMTILREVFGDGKIAELEAIAPEIKSWGILKAIGWVWSSNP